MATTAIRGQKLANELAKMADRLEGKFRQAFFRAMLSIADDAELKKLLKDIQAGRFTYGDPIDARLESVRINLAEMNEVARQAIAGSAKVTKDVMKLTGSFDVVNDSVIEAAKTLSVELSTYLKKSTKESLREIIEDLISGNISEAEALRRIQLEVGLLPQHVKAVSNYRKTLINAGTPRGRANQLAEQYTKRLLKYRANMISRTEVARATGIGQTQFWRQMRDQGSLPPQANRIWITAMDERACPFCSSMNGQVATIDGGWETEKGYMEYPQGSHPHCRCSSGIVMQRTTKTGRLGAIAKVEEFEFDQWIEKHLAGKHDQKAHTPRSYANKKIVVTDRSTPDSKTLGQIGSVKTARAQDSRAKKIAEEIFEVEMETPLGRIRSQVEEVYYTPELGTLEVGGTLRDAGGYDVGTFTRMIYLNTKVADNILFRLNDEWQGSGVGTAFMQHWEDQYARAGITKMVVGATTSGSQMNGAYTWAKYGYKPTKKGAKQLNETFIEYLTAGGWHTQETWAVRKQITKRYNLPEDAPSNVVAEKMVAEFGNSILKPMAEFPMMKEILKGERYNAYVGDVSWVGTKRTRMIRKVSEDEMDVVERWMRDNPQGLENDDPEFWKQIKATYSVSKHQSGKHDQRKHASKRKSSAPSKGKVATTDEVGIAGIQDLTDAEYVSLVEQQNKKVTETFDSGEEWAFNHYFGENYGGINNVMRRGARTTSTGEIDRYDEIMLEYVSSMKEGFKKASVELPRDTVLYRGIRIEKTQKFNVGDVIEDRAFASTTSNSDRAFRFAGTGENDPAKLVAGDKSVVMVIKMPKGHKVMVGGKLAPFFEEEVLLQPSTKMKVVNVETFSDPYWKLKFEKVTVELV